MHDVTAWYTAAEIRAAQVVHEAIRALQYVQGDDAPSPPWHCAPDHLKATCLDGIRRALAGETPEQHHEAWCEWKRRHGWVLGDRKDDDARTHPCLKPYRDLPRHQQVKDLVFLAVAREMTA